MRLFFKVLVLILCCWGTARFCKLQTGSFTIARISSQLQYHPEWEVPALSENDEQEIKKALSQPYYFFSKGAQSFVFASEDGTAVIKFFRHHHLSAPSWVRFLPLAWARHSIHKKNSKLSKDFTSYKLAYEVLREESGLLYLHLNKTSHLNLTLDLVDNLGIHHPLPLDQYEFVVQKRATLVYSALETWIQKGEFEEAKKALTSLVKLLTVRSQKGIFDKDPDLNTNFGFIGTQSLQIDIGRFKRKPPAVDQNELIRITDNLHQWLMHRAPELDRHLKEELLNEV